MIKIAKKPLFKDISHKVPVRIFIFLKACLFSLLLLYAYFILPVYLLNTAKTALSRVFLFYLTCAAALLYLFRKHSQRKSRLKLKAQDLEEQLNLLNIEHAREIKNQLALEEKIKRYNSLRNIIEEINQNLSLEAIADSLSQISFSLISKNTGVCILYLVDLKTHKLNLFKAKKEDRGLIVKTKEGDVFDLWVLRHSSPLIVEDVKKDFRFDLEKIKNEDIRPFSSLISAPLISENNFLGILRIDNPRKGAYSQDDLRFLVTISDLGAVAVENGELFQETQDLAIHDGLTAVYTKGYFLERLKEESRRSLRQHTDLSLLMLDIDHFKNYNDKLGHTAGDIVLQKLSSDICDFLKDKNPIVSRFGGEEFCVILPHTDKKAAMGIAEQLRFRIDKLKILLRRQEIGITVSIGVSSLPCDTNDEEDLLGKADQAMYSAKQKGRNRVCPA